MNADDKFTTCKSEDMILALQINQNLVKFRPHALGTKVIYRL